MAGTQGRVLMVQVLTTDQGVEARAGDLAACRFLRLVEPLEEAEAARLARSFAALSDPVRLRLLSLLATAPSGEACVCELVAPLGKAQPTVSHHLKVLAEAGLVRGERRGKWVWYSLERERLAEVRAALEA
jgi:ArsR family transcriptional regulator